ncbi:hypothetical protein [Swaminathania salitolerans]|uniref:Uncharacterized protein n=1 Tax=Swaminathania salitolerans TaxID=182838 RepID=A0A511BPX0_9PROT|nr:hypothetical protein [Swaminathania salitolerans]GBQ11204.1 hypothetical protein AA21291_0723 [Swaminathania salitolerans LMG 21291]GEL02381.1 hypothetical protein SSA02_15440 [Swaminathania salitolerans]
MYFSASRYWLLDYFGHVLDHDVLRDCLVPVVPPPGRYPGLFFFADDVTLDRFPVALRKVVSLPRPFPALQARKLPSGLVTLEAQDGSGRYLRSVENEGIDFRVVPPQDWEHFFVLSEPMMHAYAILGQPEIGTIRAMSGETLEALRFVRGHGGQIGPYAFSLSRNTPALEALASLAPGTEESLTLVTREDESIVLSVARA